MKNLRIMKQRGLIIMFFILISFIYVFPVFINIDYWGIQDWDAYFFNQEVIRDSVLQYKQIPLWNPYYCGGCVSLANPQWRFLSPFFLVTLIFGTVAAAKIEIWAHVFIGMTGIYYLCRYYRISDSSALISPAVYILSSMYALNLTAGMPWFFSVSYLPYVFLFYLKSFENIKYAFLTGVFLLLMFFGGGTYVMVITILFLVSYGLINLIMRKKRIGSTFRVFLM